MPPRLLTLLDARSRPIGILRPIRTFHLLRTGSSRTVSRAAIVLSLVYLAALTVGLGWVFTSMVRSSDPAINRLAIRLLLGTFLPAAAVAVGVSILVQWASRWHLRRQLRAYLCPGCGYTLTDLPPEADSATICPECGAAWRLTPPPYKYGVPIPSPPPPAGGGPLSSIGRRWHALATVPDSRATPWPAGAPANSWAKRPRPLGRVLRFGRLLLLLLAYFALYYAAAIGLLVLVSPSDESLGPSLAAIAFVTIAPLIPILLGGLALVRRRAPAHIRRNLESPRCPICARPLTDLPASPDGCTQCPDCGAAWRLPLEREP